MLFRSPDLFSYLSSHHAPLPERLTQATPEDLESTLAHALRHDGKKPFKPSGEATARITAAHLLRALTQSGFIVMKRPPPALPTHCAYAESAARVMKRTEET